MYRITILSSIIVFRLSGMKSQRHSGQDLWKNMQGKCMKSLGGAKREACVIMIFAR